MLNNIFIKSILLASIGSGIIYLMRDKADDKYQSNNYKLILPFVCILILALLYQVCISPTIVDSGISKPIEKSSIGGCPF